jgi:hypothetical protein
MYTLAAYWLGLDAPGRHILLRSTTSTSQQKQKDIPSKTIPQLLSLPLSHWVLLC